MCVFGRETACGLLMEDVKWITIIFQLIQVSLQSFFSTYMCPYWFFKTAFTKNAYGFHLVFWNLFPPNRTISLFMSWRLGPIISLFKPFPLAKANTDTSSHHDD